MKFCRQNYNFSILSIEWVEITVVSATLFVPLFSHFSKNSFISHYWIYADQRWRSNRISRLHTRRKKSSCKEVSTKFITIGTHICTSFRVRHWVESHFSLFFWIYSKYKKVLWLVYIYFFSWTLYKLGTYGQTKYFERAVSFQCCVVKLEVCLKFTPRNVINIVIWW